MATTCFSSFCQILDKGIWSSPLHQTWNISESNTNASFRSLDITFQGALLALDKASYQGIYGAVNTKISTKIEDRDCDGFAVYGVGAGEDERVQKAIVAVEMKSSFDSYDLMKAYKQLVYTYLKMHSLLSFCDGYHCLEYKIIGVIACHPPKDEGKYLASIHARKNSGENVLPDLRFMDTMYQANSAGSCHMIPLSKVSFLQNLPLHPDLRNKTLHLYLHLTSGVNDVHSVLALDNLV